MRPVGRGGGKTGWSGVGERGGGSVCGGGVRLAGGASVADLALWG